MNQRMARAMYRAVHLSSATPPYDSASLKIYYPALYGDTPEERNSGVIPVDPAAGPCPVVILLPGINVSPESYSWLATELALAGVVTVMPSLVAEEMPGYISLTPGLSIEALTPAQYGMVASATLLTPIRELLEQFQAEGVLAGQLDLDRIILGGHSAGGSVAMLNARRDWLPGLAGAFSYGAHAATATALEHPEDHYFPLSDDVPMLIMGGTRDGCIANSASRYGDGAAEASELQAATEKLVASFERAVSRDQGDTHLVLIEGANHFTMAHPHDGSTGRPFIDFEAVGDEADIRGALTGLITAFIEDTTPGSSGQSVKAACAAANGLIHEHRCR